MPIKNIKIRTERVRVAAKNRIIDAINSLIKSIFEKKNKKDEGQKFIDNYVKFFFVNLV